MVGIETYEESFEAMRRRKNRGRSFKDYKQHLRKQTRVARIPRRIDRRKELRDIPPALKRQVYETYGDMCYICSKRGADTLDHVIPIIKGGETTLKNLRPAHDDCNQEKGGKIIILPEELEEVGW